MKRNNSKISEFLRKTLILFLIFWGFELWAISFRGRIFSRVKNKGEGGITVFIFETKKQGKMVSKSFALTISKRVNNNKKKSLMLYSI